MARARNICICTAAASAVALLALLPSTAVSQGCSSGPPSGGVGLDSGTSSGGAVPRRTPQQCTGNAYVNPFGRRAWQPSRIDMGVDYMPTKPTPVVAIGDAKILGSTDRSGWPGGGFIWYKLLDGDHAGAIVFVAESLKKLTPAGTQVAAGDTIATAVPGGTGIEIGWATKDGQARAWPCYHEGMATASGKSFARFLRSLGADLADRPGPGTNQPTGDLC